MDLARYGVLRLGLLPTLRFIANRANLFFLHGSLRVNEPWFLEKSGLKFGLTHTSNILRGESGKDGSSGESDWKAYKT